MDKPSPSGLTLDKMRKLIEWQQERFEQSVFDPVPLIVNEENGKELLKEFPGIRICIVKDMLIPDK